jgi:hypothetical protein
MTISQDSTHPTGVSDDSPRGSSGAVVARLRKAKAALTLRRDHYTWDQIAEALGYPTGRAALVATEQALANELQTSESQEFMRKMAGDRLDRLGRSVWKKATSPEDPEHLAAVDRARLLVAQHAELFGYVAPKKSLVVNPTSRQLEEWVSAVLKAQTPTLEEADIFGDIEDAVVVEDEDEPDAVSS